MSNATACTVPLYVLQEHLPSLCEAVRNQDRSAADNWKKQPHWREVENLIIAASGGKYMDI